MDRNILHKKLIIFATDPSSANIIYTILKDHNEQVEIINGMAVFDVRLIKDKTIATLNKFLML